LNLLYLFFINDAIFPIPISYNIFTIHLLFPLCATFCHFWYPFSVFLLFTSHSPLYHFLSLSISFSAISVIHLLFPLCATFCHFRHPFSLFLLFAFYSPFVLLFFTFGILFTSLAFLSLFYSIFLKGPE